MKESLMHKKLAGSNLNEFINFELNKVSSKKLQR